MIIEDYSEQINDFSDHLTDKLEAISKISVDNHILFQKILYVAFLDSLSAAVYPKEKVHNKRFRQFIDNYSDWKEKDNICLTHFSRFVSLSSNPNLKTVYAMIDKELQSRESRLNENIFISEDPTFNELNKLWIQEFKEKKINLSYFKHSSLLYQLRNSLVHQFQTLDEFENESSAKPFYRVYQEFDIDKGFIFKEIKLIYPQLFLKELSESALANTIKYFQKNNKNPFPDYYAGDYWIEELN